MVDILAGTWYKKDTNSDTFSKKYFFTSKLFRKRTDIFCVGMDSVGIPLSHENVRQESETGWCPFAVGIVRVIVR